MLPRVLEPEVMDTPQEAVDYDAMDHRDVNRVFVDDLLAELSQAGIEVGGISILDAGTGTAQIPIELVSRFCEPSDVADGSRRARPAGFGGHITATDLAEEMLKVARQNVTAAGYDESIRLEHVDCKALPYDDASFDAVMSNSIVHHIPEPRDVFVEMWRVLKPGGILFVRDLLRPADAGTLHELVETYAGEENDHQQQMFRESLHAALTVDEVRAILSEVGIPADSVRRTTDRHWTLAAIR